jgi:hypothetical protein
VPASVVAAGFTVVAADFTAEVGVEAAGADRQSFTFPTGL